MRRIFEKRRLTKVFSEIFETNRWGSMISRSGPGSEVVQASVLIEVFPQLFKQLDVRKILDIPCGDFNWMSQVELTGVDYLGGDIVQNIVDLNNKIYRKKNVFFKKMDLINDHLPESDLLICRDCLVHLSYKNIIKALRNIAKSKSRYIALTNFPEKKNTDIPDGRWRPLNMCEPPICLPAPLLSINEICTEGDGKYSDKELAIWEITQVKSSCLSR